MHVSFFPRLDTQEVVHCQQVYRPVMSYSEEILRHPIRKSVKDRGQCTRSNNINCDFGKITKEKPCVDLIGP